VIGKIGPSECLDEEKTQSSGTTFDRSWRELAAAKQVNLVLANMFWAEAIGRTVEVPGEILYRMDIGTDGVLSVVATLEFVQHQLPESGHSKPPCDPKPYTGNHAGYDHAVASAALAA